MGRHCCACSRKVAYGEMVFSFPLDPRRRIQWLDNAGLENVRKLSESQIRNRSLCDKHFSNESFTNKDRVRLLRTAVPTIFSSASKNCRLCRTGPKKQTRLASLEDHNPLENPVSTILGVPVSNEEVGRNIKAKYIYPCDTFCAQLYKQTNPGLSYKLEDNPLVNLPRISVKVEYDSDPLQLEPATTNNKEAEDLFLNRNEQFFWSTNPVPLVKQEDSPFVIDPGKYMVPDPDPLQLDSAISMTKSGTKSTNSIDTFTNEIVGSSISLHSAADYEVLSTKDSLNVTNTELVQMILKSEDNSEVEDETRNELLSSSLDSLKKFEEYDQKEAQTAVEISDKFVRSISAAKAMLIGYDLPKLEVAYSDTEGKQKVYLCCYCNLCFSSPSDRSSHIESHNVKIICPICCIEFFSHKIVQHLVDFHGKKRNAKSLTPKESIPAMTKSLLKGFELTELTTVYDKRSNKIVFPCCYCSDIFYSKTERENHLPNHDVKAQCHLCLQEFPSHKIKSHVKYVHVKSAANKLKDFCELCNGFYPDLSRHCMDRHSKSSVIRRFCIYCENASFATSEELLNHYEANHDDEKLACNVCDEYIFSFQQKKHMMEHGSKTKKLCPHCGKLFRFLATHVKAVHQGRTRKRPKRVQCDQCAKFLHNKQKLQFHYLSFHNPDLKCDICSKKFGSLKALNGHKRKLHKPQCNLKKRNNKLTEVNKKVVMVKCAVCKKEIACIRLFAHLVYHVWKEIGHTYDRQLQFVEQDVACPTCNTQFRCTHYLANHMTRHLDPARVYECPCCFRTFKRIGSFDFHKKSFCKTLDETVAYTMQCRTKNQLCKNKLRRRRNGHDIDAE